MTTSTPLLMIESSTPCDGAGPTAGKSAECLAKSCCVARVGAGSAGCSPRTLTGDVGKPARDGPACGLCTKVVGLPANPQIDSAFPGTLKCRRKRGERLR